jgi:hypothetical protein
MKNLKPSEFFTSVDDLDSNGVFSICKNCCDHLYEGYFRTERDMARAILKTCRKINLKFDEGAVESAKLHIATKKENGTDVNSVIGTYKSKLVPSQKNNFGDKVTSLDLTFIEPNIVLPLAHPLDSSESSTAELQQKWGKNYNFEDYEYLEREYSEWEKTNSCETKAEKKLIIEICHKSLEIEKRREETGTTPSNLVKELQEIMKTAAVDPSKANAAGAGRTLETFSGIIKIIEETEPADYFEDKEMFKDFDKIGWYFRKYITRPLKNFITQSRDFNVADDDSEDDDSEFEDFVSGASEEN